MAFPGRLTLKEALELVQRVRKELRDYSIQSRDAMAESSVSANAVEQVARRFSAGIADLDRAAAVPGIGQYARDQWGDQGFDLAAQFTAMRDAAIVVRNTVHDAMPKDPDGWALKDRYHPDRTITTRQFSPTQTVPVRTVLDAFLVTVG